jgi:hypothetical protein
MALSASGKKRIIDSICFIKKNTLALLQAVLNIAFILYILIIPIGFKYKIITLIITQRISCNEMGEMQLKTARNAFSMN